MRLLYSVACFCSLLLSCTFMAETKIEQIEDGKSGKRDYSVPDSLGLRH